MLTIEAFGQQIATELSRLLGVPVVAYDDDHSLKFGSNNFSGEVNTENFYKNYCNGMPLDRIVNVFAQSFKEANPKYDDVKNLLRLSPVLNVHSLGKHLTDDSTIGIIIEHDTYRNFVVDHMLASLGKTEDELWDIAYQNMLQTMPPAENIDIPGCDLLAFKRELGAGYAYVRAAGLQGDVYLSMPYVDLGVIATNIDPQHTEDVLRQHAIFTYKLYEDAPDHPLTPAVYHFRDGQPINAFAAMPVKPH